MQEILLSRLKRIRVVPTDIKFVKELTNEELISYSSLAQLVEMTSGTLINEDSGWLSFTSSIGDLIIAKRNIRRGMSWDMLKQIGCVYGSKHIVLNGITYRVRLIQGADDDPFIMQTDAYNQIGSMNSEWTQMFYPLVSNDSRIPNPNPDAPYTVSDLGFVGDLYSMCQEVNVGNASRILLRGMVSCTHSARASRDQANPNRAWRPCLERV